MCRDDGHSCTRHSTIPCGFSVTAAMIGACSSEWSSGAMEREGGGGGEGAGRTTPNDPGRGSCG